MKVITEAILREELQHQQPKTYCVEEGKILSPAAREYLQQRKIAIIVAKEKKNASNGANVRPGRDNDRKKNRKARYVDHNTGESYEIKPEHMTQLYGNELVTKDHPRIAFRGAIDNLQAEIVLTQALACRMESPALLEDLNDVLDVARQIVRSEVMNEPMGPYTLLGLDAAGLREHSHHPEKYYQIKQMLLPDYSMGEIYARLNLIRTKVRQTEVQGVQAFRNGEIYEHEDILEALNRLSSAMHIMMCRYLAGDYNDGNGHQTNH